MNRSEIMNCTDVKIDVTFRRATIDDIKGIIDLCNECFEENTSMEYATRVFKETMDDKNQNMLFQQRHTLPHFSSLPLYMPSFRDLSSPDNTVALYNHPFFLSLF